MNKEYVVTKIFGIWWLWITTSKYPKRNLKIKMVTLKLPISWVWLCIIDIYLQMLISTRSNISSLRFQVTTKEFWDFSIDEHAKYDLPAMVDYVLQHTNEKHLHYVGHSQGTVMAFAALSENPDLRWKIRAHFALRPITRMMDVSRIVRFVFFVGRIDIFEQRYTHTTVLKRVVRGFLMFLQIL